MSLTDLIGKTVKEVNIGLAELFAGNTELRRGEVYQIICTDGTMHHYFTYSDLDLSFDAVVSSVEVKRKRLMIDGKNFNDAVIKMDFVPAHLYPQKVKEYLLNKP